MKNSTITKSTTKAFIQRQTKKEKLSSDFTSENSATELDICKKGSQLLNKRIRRFNYWSIKRLLINPFVEKSAKHPSNIEPMKSIKDKIRDMNYLAAGKVICRHHARIAGIFVGEKQVGSRYKSNKHRHKTNRTNSLQHANNQQSKRY